jgi:hypothetical protein
VYGGIGGCGTLLHMQPPVDFSRLGPAVARILDAKAPPPLRQMGARGIAPGLRPHEAVTVIALLAESDDEAVSGTARATLEKLPPPLLAGAINPDLPPGVVDAIAPRYSTDAAVMEKFLALPQIPMETVAIIAARASEAVAELIATNEERMLRNPTVIEKLYLNKSTRMSTADRLIELAVRNNLDLTGIPAFREAASAIAEELIPEATAERNFDDEQFLTADEIARNLNIDLAKEDTHVVDDEGHEVVVEKIMPLYAQLASMSVSNRIRRAQLGTGAERMILVRDVDRRVAVAAIKSPMIQEAEVTRISASRNISEDVLRVIAMDREWTRSHQVKVNLVSNPRCPFAFASKLLLHLRDHELKNLARSKNVPGSVVQAAKNQLRKKGHDV